MFSTPRLIAPPALCLSTEIIHQGPQRLAAAGQSAEATSGRTGGGGRRAAGRNPGFPAGRGRQHAVGSICQRAQLLPLDPGRHS